MADEVVITYWTKASNARAGSSQPIYGKQLGGQVLDIATLSATIPASVSGERVEIIKLKSKGTGFWYTRGTALASAVADADGNDWLDAGESTDLEYDPENTYIDTAADA